MKVRVPLLMVLLLLVNAALISALAWRVWAVSIGEPSQAENAAALDLTFPVVDVPAVAAIDAIQARAIFHQSRSFYVAPAAPQTETPPPHYRLAGSMSIAGRASATLIDGQTGTRLRVSVGDPLQGWTVAAIQPGKVTLHMGDRVADITSASIGSSRGVIVVGAPITLSSTPSPAPGSGPSPSGGVRVLGNAPIGASALKAAPDTSSSHPARFYRPVSP